MISESSNSDSECLDTDEVTGKRDECSSTCLDIVSGYGEEDGRF